jgi:hypothetical protein
MFAVDTDDWRLGRHSASAGFGRQFARPEADRQPHASDGPIGRPKPGATASHVGRTNGRKRLGSRAVALLRLALSAVRFKGRHTAFVFLATAVGTPGYVAESVVELAR